MSSEDARAVCSSSRILTTTCLSLGTSTPTVFFPGIGATTRTEGTRNAIARSSSSAVILFRRRPRSSSSSNCVTTGPVSISATLTFSPNSSNAFSSVVAATRAFFASSSYGNSSDSNNKLISGNENPRRCATGTASPSGLCRASDAGGLMRIERPSTSATSASGSTGAALNGMVDTLSLASR